MSSIEDLIRNLSSIREESSALSQMIAGAAGMTAQQANIIAALTKGSRTGQDAAREVQMASKSLGDCSSAIVALKSAIDQYIQETSS